MRGGREGKREGGGLGFGWEASTGRAAGLYRPAAVLQGPPERLRRLQGQPARRLLPTKLGMDPGEGFVWAPVTADFSGHLLFFFETARWPAWPCRPIRPDPPQEAHGRLLRQVPLAAACLLTESDARWWTSTEGRVVVFHTAALTPKTTRSTQGSTS